jgi:hypothetical protein
LGTSYLLLLAAPLVSARLSGLAHEGHWAALAHWIPAASGAGLALGGGAALLLVLARLSKDIRQHPYACVAPALAAFAACVLIGLGAKLPLGPCEPLCVFALALSVMGGSLVEVAGAGSQIFGWSLTVAPSVSLVAAVWAASGQAQLSAAIWSLSATSRLFLAMLALSSVAMALLGMVARTLTALQAPRPMVASARVAAPVQWNANPFSEREDTLDIALRSAERELRRRPIARPVLFVACFVLAGTAVAVWQRIASTELSSATLVTKSADLGSRAQGPASTPTQVAMIADTSKATEPVPQVEPYVPTVAAASAPTAAAEVAVLPGPPTEPESARDRKALELALVVQAPEESQGALERESEARSEPLMAESPVVVTSRASHSRKPRVARSKHKMTPSRATSRAAKVSTALSEEADVPNVKKMPAPEAKKAAAVEAAAPTKSQPPVPTRGDESLDELMDRVVEPKPGKATVSADDPIFGL